MTDSADFGALLELLESIGPCAAAFSGGVDSTLLAAAVLDGSNLDDTKEYRPGRRALEELGVRSPLLELGFTKAKVRRLSKDLGLSTANKPPYACLLTRFPHDTPVTEKALSRVEAGELYLRQRGLWGVRLRSHGETARIEVDPRERRKFFDESFLDEAAKHIKGLGYTYVALDLEGYRTGSMNGGI